MARIYFRAEIELSGQGAGWTEITSDVHGPSGIQGSRGFRDVNPLNRVATTSLLTLALINSAEGNSAGLDGYYSPGHANVRTGFATNIGIRVSLVLDPEQIGWITPTWITPTWISTATDPTVIPLWTGEITDIEPTSGQYLERLVRIQARCYIEKLARHRLSALNVAEGIGESAAFQQVIDNMPVQPRATSVASGPDTYGFAFDQAQDESTVALGELQRIGLSSLGLIYVDPNGTLVYEPRNQIRADPLNELTPDVTLTESDIRNRRPLVVEDKRGDIINRVEAVLRPRDVDGSPTVLFTTPKRVGFPPGGPYTLRALYTDASERSERIGAVDPIAPVASTDYDFNEEEDGSGADITTDVVVTHVSGGNAGVFTVTNNSGKRAWGTFQARGTGVQSQEPIMIEATDSAGIAADGENSLAFEMPYQSDIEVARQLVHWMLHVMSQATRKIRDVRLFLDPSDFTRAQALAERDISDVFSISETMTAFDGTERFFINAVGFESRWSGGANEVWLTWTPEVANAKRLWHLGVSGFTELGVNTHLGIPTLTAFAAPHLTTGGSTTAATSYQTDSVTPTADALVLVWVAYGRNDSTNPTTPTLSGCGCTWVEVASVNYKTTGVDRRRISLFRTLNASPTPGKITITHGAQQSVCSWSVAEFTGVNTGGANGADAVVQSATATGIKVSTLTAALAAFADSGNRPAIGAGLRNSDVMFPEGGHSLLGRRTTQESIISAWKDDGVDTTPSVLIQGFLGEVGAVAVEIEKV